MRYFLYLLVCCSFPMVSHAGSYTDSINLHRQHYKEEFLAEERSPLKAADTGYLRFYQPDENYRVVATFMPTPDAKPFMMPTRSGKVKEYRQYGTLTFRLHGKQVTMWVYQSQTLMKDPKYKNHLFLPFTDDTNITETYGGGRYIDLDITDIKNNKIVVDFNKCYNPYCAYADGYNCPIPPKENSLDMEIKAGELVFGKTHGE